jgi:hypothetical protein
MAMHKISCPASVNIDATLPALAETDDAVSPALEGADDVVLLALAEATLFALAEANEAVLIALGGADDTALLTLDGADDAVPADDTVSLSGTNSGLEDTANTSVLPDIADHCTDTPDCITTNVEDKRARLKRKRLPRSALPETTYLYWDLSAMNPSLPTAR